VWSCKTECKTLQLSSNKWPLHSGFLQSAWSGDSTVMEGKSTEKSNLNRINVMQAGRELHDLQRSDREPEGWSSSSTDFWRSSTEAAAEEQQSRRAARPWGFLPVQGKGRNTWTGIDWVGFLSNVCAYLCSREARGLRASLLGRSRQERGGIHPLVWGQSAHEGEGRVGNHCGDISTPLLHGGVPVA